MHKKIKLSNSTSTVALVSADDFEKVKKRGKWRLHKTGYICRDTIYKGKPVTEYLHRYLLGLKPGDNFVADHINGIKTDNTRENLRILTPAQNAQNTNATRGTSSFRGVSKNKNTWRGSVNIPGEGRRTKSFSTEKAAAVWAYKQRLLHQPFAPKIALLDDMLQEYEQAQIPGQMTIFDI